MSVSTRWGRLKRQCWRALVVYGEARTRQLAEWCHPRGVSTEHQVHNHARAARSIGAYRVRREDREWVWRLAETASDTED